MRKVVYGLLPWERKLVDVMMEDLGSAIFGGAKKTKLPDHNNHRGDDFFCNLSTWDAERHALTASYWIHWEVV